MTSHRRSVVFAVLLAGGALFAGCNDKTPATDVGSGSGPTDNAGASSGRVPPGTEQPSGTPSP